MEDTYCKEQNNKHPSSSANASWMLNMHFFSSCCIYLLLYFSDIVNQLLIVQQYPNMAKHVVQGESLVCYRSQYSIGWPIISHKYEDHPIQTEFWYLVCNKLKNVLCPNVWCACQLHVVKQGYN